MSGLRRVSRATLLSALLLVFVLFPAMLSFSADVPIATIPVGDSPAAVSVNPLSHRVYVANYYGSTVSIIDGASDTVTATPSMGSFAVPIALVSNPIATPARTYVANFWTNNVAVLSEATNGVAAMVPSNGAHAGGPRALALNPSGTTPKLYVADYGSGLVTVLNAETYAQIKTIPVGQAPRALAIFASASRNRIYAANRYSNTVSVIDGDTDSVVATVPVGAAPKAIAVDQSTGFAYVTNETSNSVTVIDDNDQVAGTIGVGTRPIGVAVDASAGRVFVANYTSNNVSVIRTSDMSHEATLTVGTSPWAIAFDEGDGKAFVTNYASSSTSVIDSALNVTNVSCGAGPYAVAVDEGASPHKAYVGNWSSDNVTVIDEPAAATPLAALESPAYAAPLSAVAVAIDPDVDTSSGAAMATGSATDMRTKYPAAVIAVFYRVAPSREWLRAEITEGAGTTAVSWAADLGTPADTPYALEVIAFDQTSAASAMSDGGSAVSGSSFGGSAQAILEIGSEPHATATTLTLARKSVLSKPTLIASVACTEAECPGPTGDVIFERRTLDGTWTPIATVPLAAGQAKLTVPRVKRATYRARYLGDEGHDGSESQPLTVRNAFPLEKWLRRHWRGDR
ncbi:MAG: YncE family protein [Coriobacteriales bacterium]|nr:YncE family protein [Coriobacteriales bacterium]